MDDSAKAHAGRLLVMPDRRAAEEVAEAVLELVPGLSESPRVVREALAGEDDAEDAQWLVVCPAPETGWTNMQLAELGAIAANDDGWLEIQD